MQEIIKVENLTKKFKNFVAVNGVSFSVKKGEIFAILGENGAGKTTLIKMLCGLLKINSGSAEIDGHSVINEMQEIKKVISICPQESAIALNLTVKENLILLAMLYGFDKVRAVDRANELINIFELQEKADQRAKTLSGGQKRRVSLATAVISNPKVLFLDEATLGLDVRARHRLWRLIQGLKGKITIILTTHYMEEAESLSDRVAIIDQGKLIAVDTVQNLKQKTKTSNLEQAFLVLTEKETFGGKNEVDDE